jgi:hypothetical protein
MAGFDVPAEQTVPALTPFIELADGRVFVAGDGADEIHPAADGKSLSATWKRWAPVGGKAGDLGEPGLTTTVSWTLSNGALIRSEKIEADKPVTLRRFRVDFPSTSERVDTHVDGGRRIDTLSAQNGSLDLEVNQSTIPLTRSIRATGNSSLSHGSRAPVLLLLEWEARDVTVQPGIPFSWIVTVQPK